MRKAAHPNFPEYLVRDDGLVERTVDSQKHAKRGDILVGRILRSGYRQFKLVALDGVRRHVRANRLVCEAFHGAAPSSKHHAAHRNGNRLDNRPDNLYWATALENKHDSIRHGTAVRGSRTGNAILTERLVAEMRAEYDGKRGSVSRLSKQYGLSRAQTSKVLRMNCWTHVPTAAAYA